MAFFLRLWWGLILASQQKYKKPKEKARVGGRLFFCWWFLIFAKISQNIKNRKKKPELAFFCGFNFGFAAKISLVSLIPCSFGSFLIPYPPLIPPLGGGYSSNPGEGIALPPKDAAKARGGGGSLRRDRLLRLLPYPP